MKKRTNLFLLIFIAFFYSSCVHAGKSRDIVILFTNDIHCNIDSNLTIPQIAYYKKYLEAKSEYVTLVDCGDAVSGSCLGLISKGAAIIDAMNVAGYDFAVFGNHEFNYGMNQLHSLIDRSNAQYLCCNITYRGSGFSGIEKSVPYKIVKYGKHKVAFIGVSTPDSISMSIPAFFKEDGKYAYDFAGGENGRKLFDVIQKNVDEVRAAGADFVVLLAHLGCIENFQYTSENCIAGTSGIDVVLDGHSHSVYNKCCIPDKEGNPVICIQTGAEMSNIGQIVISESGLITSGLITDIYGSDKETEEKINKIITAYTDGLNKILAYSEKKLSIYDENGIRTVRNQETGIGNMLADSCRCVTGADIAYLNGGVIRNSFPAGDIKLSDILSVFPFGNKIVEVEVTGQEVLDMMEYFVRSVIPETVDIAKGLALGEDGDFPHVSGIRFTVDSHIPSPVVMDENNMFLGVDSSMPRRVSQISVLENGKYVPIDINRIYTLACTNYMAEKGGNGMEFFLADHIIHNGNIDDFDLVSEFFTDYLHGDLSGYYNIDGRLNILR